MNTQDALSSSPANPIAVDRAVSNSQTAKFELTMTSSGHGDSTAQSQTFSYPLEGGLAASLTYPNGGTVPGTIASPYIGDPIINPGYPQPLIGDVFPDTNPPIQPNVLGTTFYPYVFTPSYWAVQEIQAPEKGCPRYVVVDPATASVFRFTSTYVAWAETEMQARKIAEGLKGLERKGTVKKADAQWLILVNAKGHFEMCRERQAVAGRLIARCEEENDARAILDALRPPAAPEVTGGARAFDPHYEPAITLEHFKCVVKRLGGKALTILEAAITNEAQLGAIKKLVRREFRDVLSYMYKHVVIDKGQSAESFQDEDNDLDIE